jgi:hypothetical protein
VQQLIEEEAALAEARRGNYRERRGVRARTALPAFQENGQFIGNERYLQLLQMQSPPINPGDFEEEVRRGVLLEKLQGALTDWITVADADVTAEFNRRNEKVKLAVVAFPADKFGSGVTDAEWRPISGRTRTPTRSREAEDRCALMTCRPSVSTTVSG